MLLSHYFSSHHFIHFHVDSRYSSDRQCIHFNYVPFPFSSNFIPCFISSSFLFFTRGIIITTFWRNAPPPTSSSLFSLVRMHTLPFHFFYLASIPFLSWSNMLSSYTLLICILYEKKNRKRTIFGIYQFLSYIIFFMLVRRERENGK